MRRVCAVLMMALLISGCWTPKNSNRLNRMVEIDWADMVKNNNITYLAVYQSTPPENNLIDKELSRVKFKVEGNVHNPNYKIKDGDATFLFEGTQIYSLKGYSSNFRVGVLWNNKVKVYEADYNPNSKFGSDLMDLNEKVEYIGVNSENDGAQLATIKKPEAVRSMIFMISNSKVNQDRHDQSGPKYLIKFYFKDGTETDRCYWPTTGELSRGIMLPKEFRNQVEFALKKKS